MGGERNARNHMMAVKKLADLRECRFCHLLVRTDMTPTGFYGRFLKESAICGHLRESGCDLRAGRQGDEFPILDRNLGYNAKSIKTPFDLSESADAPFSIGAAQQAAEAGSKLVGKYDDIRLAARQVREIRMRKMAPQAQHDQALLRKHPELGDEIAQLREIGALPHYGGISPWCGKTFRTTIRGCKTQLMVSKIWTDVRKGRVLVAHSDAVKPDSP